ncbi:UNVERIFIED_CONTAM: hypothetical protein Sradi_6990600 [Sesamum radiatum]|uniref:Uncharacterized protein n=1 Tax=Sesamum radiatum TaxID=300843 RepID=A0AAW2JDW7_SESRA
MEYTPVSLSHESWGAAVEIFVWIVLDFENQTYVPDRSLPRALAEESTHEERLTFEKWLEDNRKVRSIILGSMTNDIQKQYGRHDDVQSIMLRMSQIYAVPDRHIRYAATKAFFGTKIIEGSCVKEHGVKMLSLVEKLKDLKANLEKETYIDVILQSLPPSFDSFIVNYNMNGLDKDLHELINMLVQYEATIEKSAPLVFVGEALTSKAKSKGWTLGGGRKVRQITHPTIWRLRGALYSTVARAKLAISTAMGKGTVRPPVLNYPACYPIIRYNFVVCHMNLSHKLHLLQSP